MDGRGFSQGKSIKAAHMWLPGHNLDERNKSGPGLHSLDHTGRKAGGRTWCVWLIEAGPSQAPRISHYFIA